MFRYGEIHNRRGEFKVKPWLGALEPVRITEGVYFVGTYQASCHIIDTGDGLIMIDPGYTATAHIVVNSIYKLGFSPYDIKYIINSHWHGDHTEATAALAYLSGAKTIIGRDDAEKAEKYFTPDILVDDGDTLTLGNITVTFLHTPGHTKGTISPFFNVTDGDKTYRVGMFGGAGLNTLHLGKFDFEGAREAYRASVTRLKEEHVDVFIGNHAWNNDTYGKAQRVLAGEKDAFVDPELWCQFLDGLIENLDNLIEQGL